MEGREKWWRKGDEGGWCRIEEVEERERDVDVKGSRGRELERG